MILSETPIPTPIEVVPVAPAVPTELLIAGFTLVGVVLTGFLTWWAARQRTRTDAQATLMSAYRTDLTALRDRVTASETLREEDRRARLAAEAEAREADDTIRDAHETLADYRQWRAATLAHIDEGKPPPPPPPTWRMESDEAAYRRRHPDAP